MSGPSEQDEPRSDFGRAQGADEAYEVVWRKKDGEQASKSEQQTPDAAQSPASDTSRAEEYLANWQRSAADMANMRRRHETDKADFRSLEIKVVEIK